MHSGETSVITRAILAIVFLLMTAPLAAHMIGRAAYRASAPLSPETRIAALVFIYATKTPTTASARGG